MPSIIFLLGAASFIVVAVMTVTGPLLPLLAAEFGVSVGRAGLIVTAFAVPYGAFQILFGPLGDRYGKLRVMSGALAAASVFTLACGGVATLSGLISARALCGLAMAGTVPLAMAWIADEVPYAGRQLVIGRYINGLVLGQIAGGSLGGIAAEYFDWRQIFYLFGAGAALVAACLARQAWRRGAPPHLPVASHPAAVLATYGALLRVRRSRDIIVVGTLEGGLVFGVLTYFGAFLRDTFALDYATIGLALGCYGLGGLIYSALVYRLVPLLGERRMILIGTLLLGGCYLVMPLVTTWWWMLPLFSVAGFGFYTFHNTLQTQATEMSVAARGTALSLWVFMMFSGQGLGVVLFGLAVDGVGYTSAFVAGGAAVIVLGLWCQQRMRSWH